MKQYYTATSSKSKLEKVFDCMNSWGFNEPVITMKYNDQSIMGIYKVTPKVKLLNKSTNTTRTNGELGGSADVVYGKAAL